MPSEISRAQQLREERARLAEKLKDMHRQAEGRALNAEERQEWDRVDNRLNEAKREIDDLEDRHERIREVEGELEAKQERLTRSTDPDLKSATSEEIEDLHRRALNRYIRGDEDVLSRPEFRTLNAQLKGTNNVGGFTVPTDFRAELFEALKAFGGMRRAGRILTTDNGRDLQIPRSDDTGNTAQILAEATAPSTSTAVPFGQVTLEATKYRVGPIKISREIVEDSALDIESIVRESIEKRFGRATNNHYTLRSSTETVGPHGIVNDSTGDVKVATAAALTPDKLLDLIHSVDPAYRMGGASFMFNDITFKTIRKLRESSTGGANIGAFLWQPGMVQGAPDMLLGHPIIINQDLADVGSSGTKNIWFGDFSYYVIRDVSEATLRLTERYADEDVIALYAFMRTDGRGVLPSTAAAQKPYKSILST